MTRIHPRLPALAGAALLVSSLAACSGAGGGTDSPPTTPPTVEQGEASDPVTLADLTARDGRELVDSLDRTPLSQRPGYIASVRAEEVLLDVDGEQGSIPLPDDEFYVSIAPYVNTTHECTYHSLTTCVGELFGEQMHVVVTDDAGQVLVDEDLETFDNGFFGLWLPREMSGTIEITHPSGTVRAPISTGEDDPTCVTDLRLG